MGNPFNALSAVAKEYQRYYNTKKVMPAIRVGNNFVALETVYIDLSRKKIRFICWYLSTKGVRIRKSNTSESLYFYINGVSFRVSDHKSNYAEHINHTFIVRHDSCVVQVLYSINMAHFKLDQYLG